MTMIEQAEQFLSRLEAALENDNAKQLSKLMDENRQSAIDWDLMPEKVAEKYDYLMEMAVERFTI